jgi:hypothetical protein
MVDGRRWGHWGRHRWRNAKAPGKEMMAGAYPGGLASGKWQTGGGVATSDGG